MQSYDFAPAVEQLKPYLATYLEEHGINPTKKFNCLNPEHEDSTPSCNLVGADTATPRFYCHGCLEEHELVLTSNGFREIKDLNLGEWLWTHEGTMQQIVGYESKVGSLWSIETSSFRNDPLLLTPDHTCLVLKRDCAISCLPYIRQEKDRIKFYGRYKKAQSNSKISFSELAADQVEPGDFIAYPVFKEEVSSLELTSIGILKEYTKGPQTARVSSLPANKECAYLYGLYLAEGSTGSRHVTWSFNLSEKDTLAIRVQQILKEQFNLESSILLRKEHNLCEVICSKADLARQLEFWFGKGCENKKIPGRVLSSWTQELLNSLLTGYFDGDGCKKSNSLVTTSQQLAYGIYTIAIRLNKLPSLSYYPSYVSYGSNKQTHHRASWRVYFRQKESLKGFYETIGDTEYYLSIITRSEALAEVATVIDIQVACAHSFVSKLGTVHNCGMAGDIFDAVKLLEHKTGSGLEWVEETLKYLAHKYGVEVQTKELTDEEIYELDTFRAYRAAAQLLKSVGIDPAKNPIFYSELERRGWKPSDIAQYGVGTVVSFDEFYEALANQGFPKKFLAEIDLNRKDIFNPDNLIFTWKDEKGRPIGFTARNLKYETEKAEAEKKGEKYQGKKYNNQRTTGLKVNIFQKGRRLYGIDTVSASAGPLYIFEGQADMLTARVHGLSNCVAIAGSALHEDHIQLLKKLGIFDVVLCLDGDEVGQKKLAEILETRFAGKRDMKVRVVILPDPEDPDSFIRKFGIQAFRDLAHWTAFEWRLNQYPEETDETEICKQMIPFIVNEPSPVVRDKLAKSLSKRTGVTLKAITDELNTLLDAKANKRTAARRELLDGAFYELRNNPDDAETILHKTQAALLDLVRVHDADTLSHEDFVRALDEQKAHEENLATKDSGLKLGNDLRELQEILRGDWEGTFICIGGKPNVGKTAFLSKLAYSIADNNPNVVVVYHTIDDTAEQMVPRFVAIGEGNRKLSINMVRQPNYWQNTVGLNYVLERREKGYEKVRKLALDGRLVVKDLIHGGTVPFIENLINYYQDQFPDRYVVYVLDNFHKLRDFDGKSDERVRFKTLSEAMKGIAIRRRCTIISTVEYTKLAPGIKPTNHNIGECLTGDTLVYDPSTNTRKRIDSISIGDSVLTLSNNQKLSVQKVQAILDKGVQPVWLVKTATGRSLKTTMGHPFLSDSGWTKLKDLKVGSWIGIPRNMGDEGIILDNLPPLAARLLGYLAGDGSYVRRNGVFQTPSFTNKEQAYINDVKYLIACHFTVGIKTKIHNGSTHLLFPRIKGFFNQRNPIIEWLNSLGIAGQKGSSKQIPARVFTSSREVKRQYLAGLFATDGCVHTQTESSAGRITFANKSKYLIYGAQQLLLELGIQSSIIGPDSTGMLRLTILAAWNKTFALTIPLIGSKGERLKTFLNNKKITNSGDMLPPKFVEKLREIRKSKGLKVRGRDHYWIQKNTINRKKAEQFIADLSDMDMNEWTESDIFWDRIIEITELPPEQTWDLTIENTHNFVANDIFCHNTGQIEYDASAIIHLYSDVTDNPESFTVCHTDLDWQGKKAFLPRVEFIVGKNKISEQKRSFFLDFWPASSDYRFVEQEVVLEESKQMKQGRKEGFNKSDDENLEDDGLGEYFTKGKDF